MQDCIYSYTVNIFHTPIHAAPINPRSLQNCYDISFPLLPAVSSLVHQQTAGQEYDWFRQTKQSGPLISNWQDCLIYSQPRTQLCIPCGVFLPESPPLSLAHKQCPHTNAEVALLFDYWKLLPDHRVSFNLKFANSKVPQLACCSVPVQHTEPHTYL